MTTKKIALVGNPNSGKTTLFNRLTGLNSKTGNFSGVTVEIKKATTEEGFTIIDFPGIYSLYPKSEDEQIAIDILKNQSHKLSPDLVAVVADALELKRSLLLFYQLYDLGLPLIFIVNMHDTALSKGLKINQEALQQELKVPCFFIEAKSRKGLENIQWEAEQKDLQANGKAKFQIPAEFQEGVNEIKQSLKIDNDYKAWLKLVQKTNSTDENETNLIAEIRKKNAITPKRLQVKETVNRYQQAAQVLEKTTIQEKTPADSLSEKLDRLLLHPVLGYLIFFGLLLLIFQAIYHWSGIPMDLIDESFGKLSSWLLVILPAGPIAELITQGIIPGLAGVIIFIPQIAILFLFLSMMEQSGYMARIVSLMDKFMRPFGLNGKSAVPLMSGAACAIPAIMSARNIENPKERLITMLVTPFITCSARLPIYAILIALVIPANSFLGFNAQAWVLFGLYALGVLAALLSGLALKGQIKSEYKSYLILELPNYRLPNFKDVLRTVYSKTKDFVWEAGKIIFSISIILWLLAQFSWKSEFYKVDEQVEAQYFTQIEDKENWIQAQKLEHSALGQLGKIIEPAIEPLGYDWKIGIGLISSFAAREVFVGTMSTIYSLGDGGSEQAVQDKMAAEKRKDGTMIYTLATGLSLLLFYVFAMQCMSTLAVMKKETKHWKWPLIQFVVMFVLAYASAFCAFQIFK